MKAKKSLLILAGVFSAVTLIGCANTGSDPAEEVTTEEVTAEDAGEDTSDTDETPGTVKLAKGENEYTDAVYEFARMLDEMKQGEFASYLVDFDGNGKNEAFVLRGQEDETDASRWYSRNVWFVNEDLKVVQVFGWYSPNVTYYINEEFKDVDGRKVFYLGGYDVYDENEFCYMYTAESGKLVDLTEEFKAEKNVFESKYTQEQLDVMSPGELFDAFCAGEVQAEYKNEDGTTDYFDTRDWGWSQEDMNDYQKVLDPYDLDNDGEPEYIVDTMYGILCFDCKDGKVILFAGGYDTTSYCEYITYENATWIVNRDTTHTGRCYYELRKFNADLEAEDKMNLYWLEDDAGNREYYFKDEAISEDKYNEIYDSIFK